MKRSFSCVAVALVAIGMAGIATSAFAADVAPRVAPVYKAPAFVPESRSFDWSGFYLGINGGYGFGRTSWSDPLVGAASGNFSNKGGLLGGQVGYNWQTGKTVLGIESDLNWANLKGSSAAGGVCATDGGGQCETQQSWLGSTRARLGYAIGRFLPFVTGGVAYGDVKAVQPTGTSSSTRAGWTAGGGVEYGISRNWSAKLEYQYLDLGTATFMGAASGTPTLSVPVTDNIVRAGLNYHW
jgi:outer membrane immunogenic protein